MMIEVPDPEALSAYYRTYLKYVNPGDDLLELIRVQQDKTKKFLAAIPEEKALLRYAPGKWQLKEVAGHVCDTERILACRILRISRRDRTPLPGFDENTYTPASNYSRRALGNIAAELHTVREATLSLLENLDAEMIDLKGIANDEEISVRAIVFMIYVHQEHHMNVIREKYLA